VAHVASARTKPAPARKPASPVAHVATPSRYTPNTAPKGNEYMSKIQCRACDKMGHYARDCPNPSKKPLSERPNAYARAKSPAPDRRDPRTPSTTHVAIEVTDNTYEWGNDDTGLGCVTVHTAPVSIRFDSI
jgi:hypothetical protein